MGQGLKFVEIREAVRAYFVKGIENARAQRADMGPLSAERLAYYIETADKYDAAVRSGQHWDPTKHAQQLDDLIKMLGLPIEPGTPNYDAFRIEHMRGWRDLTRAVAEESKQLEVFDFSLPVRSTNAGKSDRLIKALWEEFREYGKTEQRWTPRTIEAKEAHITLLIEMLGANRSVRNIDRDDALHVRSMLTRYPSNRHKVAKTRNLPNVSQVLDLEGVGKMHWRTVNKYLGTYSGLFDWAEKNGRVERSPFASLTLKAPKGAGDPAKRPFSMDELRRIKAIVIGDVGLVASRKWATLLAMHSGARQNEICQLLVSDIVDRDGALCMDISLRIEAGSKKQLKNAASRRLVPVHEDVIAAGFLDYVESVRPHSSGRLFPLLAHSKNTGYARNIERWFNGPLLKRLGLDSDKSATFHSLRHSVAMLLRSEEVPEPRISAILGHEQETTTTSVYGGGFPIAILKAEIDKIRI